MEQNSVSKHASCGVAALLLLLLSGTPAARAAYVSARVDISCATPAPKLPNSAALNGEQGSTYVRVLVNSRGRPRKIRVVRSSGFEDLDDAAVAAVAGWHYVPATMDDSPISDWVTLKMDFGAHESSYQPGPENRTCGYASRLNRDHEAIEHSINAFPAHH